MDDNMLMPTCENSCEKSSPTLRERLVRKKAAYEDSLRTVNDALAALDRDPKLETALDLLGKAVRL